MKYPYTHTYVFLVVIFIILCSCRKDFYVVPVIEITEPVSFSDDIIPLFDAHCNSSGCHNTGGIPPDLTATNAYDNLFLYNLVDTISPQESPIYNTMTSSSDPMPPSGLLEPTAAATLLAWIDQGAENN